MTEVAVNGDSQASHGSLGVESKRTRKRASTRWGPDPDDPGLAIPVGDHAQDGEAQNVADASHQTTNGASKPAGLAKRKPKRSRWGPDEDESIPAAAAPTPVHEPAAASSGRRKPKRSRWGPDDGEEANVPQQSGASEAAQPPPQAAPAHSQGQGQPNAGDDTPASAHQAGVASAAAAAAEAAEVRVPGTAAAVQDALQATGLQPPKGPVAEASAADDMEIEQTLPYFAQPPDLAQPAERFALPEGVDPLAAVLLRHRVDPEAAVATAAGGPGAPLSPSASDASEAAEEKLAKSGEQVLPGPPQPKVEPGKPSQQSILQSLQPSQSSTPATTSHVQAMVRVFEEKPVGQLQATGGQLPWASGTHRAAAGRRPAPPRPPADPEKEWSLLEEARALAAQAAAEQKARQAGPAPPAAGHASQTAAYLASVPSQALPPPPQPPQQLPPPPQLPQQLPATQQPLVPVTAAAAPACLPPPQPPLTAPPAAVENGPAASAGEPAPAGQDAAQHAAAAADPYAAYGGYYGQYGYYAAAAAGDPYAAHYAAAYGAHYDPYTAYSAAAAGYDPYAADAANAEQWAAYYAAQAGGQDAGAQTAEPEVPPGTEEEKPAEEVEPKKEPKVQVVPLPPPSQEPKVQVVPLPPPKVAASLEPPVVPLRLPKSVRERQEAAAAAAAQPEAADVSADAAPADTSPEEAATQAAIPWSQHLAMTSSEQPLSADNGAPAPKAAVEGKAAQSEDEERPKERAVDKREPPGRGRSLSPSPARSPTRSPPRKDRKVRRAEPSGSPPPRRPHRERGARGSRRSASPRRPRRARQSPRPVRRSITPRPRRSPSVQEPRSSSPAESVEEGEIPGGPEAAAGELPLVAAAASPSRSSPDHGPPARWQEPSRGRGASAGAKPMHGAAVGRGPPGSRGGPASGRGGGRRGGVSGRGAPPERWDGRGSSDRWEHDSFEGPTSGGSRGGGHREGPARPPTDRWEMNSYDGSAGGGGYNGGGRGQYGGQQGRQGRDEEEYYPASPGVFGGPPQPMVVSVPPAVVPAGPYGIYGGLAAGQLGLAPMPMAGRHGAFPPPMRGRGRGPAPPPGGRGRGRW